MAGMMPGGDGSSSLPGVGAPGAMDQAATDQMMMDQAMAAQGGMPADQMGGMPPMGQMGMPMGSQFPSTDPMSIAQFIAGLFKQMSEADQNALEMQQQAAFAQADPLIRAILGGDGEHGMMGAGMPGQMLAGQAFGEGGQPGSAFGED